MARGRDDIEGDEGDDRLHGGGGFDEIEGGEGRDRLYAGGGGAELSGGAGDDTLFGCDAAADVFSLRPGPVRRRPDRRFENGSDRIEIADYTGGRGLRATSRWQQRGSATRLSFAEGSVELAGFDAKLIDASDFHFL